MNSKPRSLRPLVFLGPDGLRSLLRRGCCIPTCVPFAPSAAGRGESHGFGHADVEEGVASLHPLQPGQVDKVHVKESQAVRSGEVLVSLDKRLADCLVRQLRALREAEIQRDRPASRAQQSLVGGTSGSPGGVGRQVRLKKSMLARARRARNPEQRKGNRRA